MLNKLLNLKMKSVYNDEDTATLKHNLGILAPVALLLLFGILMCI